MRTCLNVRRKNIGVESPIEVEVKDIKRCSTCYYYTDERCMNADTKLEVMKLTGVIHLYEGMRQLPGGLCCRWKNTKSRT